MTCHKSPSQFFVQCGFQPKTGGSKTRAVPLRWLSNDQVFGGSPGWWNRPETIKGLHYKVETPVFVSKYCQSTFSLAQEIVFKDFAWVWLSSLHPFLSSTSNWFPTFHRVLEKIFNLPSLQTESGIWMLFNDVFVKEKARTLI